MQQCLSHPTHGYYTSPDNKVFGARGDFITSPEISQVFGEVCASNSKTNIVVNARSLQQCGSFPNMSLQESRAESGWWSWVQERGP